MNKISNFSVRGGIFAAGRGERLRGGNEPLKPLVKVGGQTLIEHVLHSMAGAGAFEVVVIVNEDSIAVRNYVTAETWPFRLRWIIENTAGSMHSFLRLVETLGSDGDEGPFLLSTVDTVAGPETYARFIAQARRLETTVTLALTSPGSDDRPLLVRMGPGGSRIVAIGNAAAPSQYATAGIYAVRRSILREADAARNDGIDSLRTFLARLLDRDYSIAGIPIKGSIDVDRPADIATAEAFLRAATI